MQHFGEARTLIPIMFNKLSRIAGCALVACASGCASVHSYVEGGHDTVDFHELKPRNPPTPVHLTVEFTVNGVPRPGAQVTAFNEVARSLNRSGVMLAVDDPAAASLDVSIDDQYDKNAATHDGWISGLTLGSSGSATRDEYNFTYTLIPLGPGAKPKTALYRQAMVTLVGNVAPPSYAQPQDMDQAFSVIVKQSVLQFLHDQQGVRSDQPVMIVPDGR